MKFISSFFIFYKTHTTTYLLFTSLDCPKLRKLLKVRNASIRPYDLYPIELNGFWMNRLQWDAKSHLNEARSTRWENYLEGPRPLTKRIGV